jgi:hypothetical protein
VAQTDLDTSMLDIIRKNIGKILEEGKEMTVLPFDNHQLILDEVTKAINLARVNDEDDERVDMLIQYALQAQEYMKIPEAPPPAMPPQDMGVPQASDALPEPIPEDMGMGPPIAGAM